MAISLSQLCEDAEKSYSMRLVAGSGGMENTVRWVHIVEDSEVPDFLHGNELIFTTGIAHVGIEWLKDFVISLKAKGAVGLVVNIGPHITAVPPAVIVFCEQNDFPVFTIPWTTRIVDISYDFCRRIIGNENREGSIADAFRAIIKEPSSLKTYRELLGRSAFGEKSRYTVVSISVTSNGVNMTRSAVQTMDMRIWRMIKHSNFHSSLFMHNGSLIAVRQNCSDEEIAQFCSEFEAVTGSSERNIHIGISHTVKGLADKYNIDLMTMVGFLDGINDSLVTPNPIEEMEEDTEVSLDSVAQWKCQRSRRDHRRTPQHHKHQNACYP